MKRLHILSSRIIAASLFAAVPTFGAVFFETFDYYGAPPVINNDATNLNGSKFQVGSWSGGATGGGPLPDGQSSAYAPQVIESQEGSIIFDRPQADAFIRADFSRPLIKDGTQFDFDVALSRAIGNHNKDVEIVGLDASDNEAFRLVVSADSTTTGERYRLGYYQESGGALSWDFPGAADADVDISPGTGGGYNPSFSTVSVGFSPAGYTVSFARSNAWVSDPLGFYEAVGDLVAVEFRLQGSTNNGLNSGIFFDNLYAGAKQVPEPSTTALLLIGVLGLRYGRKLFRSGTPE
jgi:hypothetical protein